MKPIVIVFISLFVLVTSDVPCVLRESTHMYTDGVYEKYNVTAANVQFYFKNKQKPAGVGPINLSNANQVTSAGFSANKDTVIVIHGWRDNHNSQVCSSVSNAYISTHDVNVFNVDWSSAASGLYINAQGAVAEVGKIVGQNIQYLVNNNHLDLSRTAIVGHSLGAHVSGIAGQTLRGQVGYIIGLDPALPCFSFNDVNRRLDPTDAKYVEVIHTCAGLLGFDVDLGHADYYPNGGSNQPGCTADVTGACSHGRSYLYYAESVISSGFVSKRCNSYQDFNNNRCSGTSDMGTYFRTKRASGTYYLRTNNRSPFAQH